MGKFELTKQIENLRLIQDVLKFNTLGNVYYVVKSTESYYANFKKKFNKTYPDNTQAVHTTLASAYAAVTSGRNDVIVLDANGSHELDSQLDIAKSRVNIIGADGGDRLVSQGAKIVLSTAGKAADTPSTILLSGTRCRLENLKIINEGTHANSVAAAVFEGEACVVKNVSCLKLTDLNVATVADAIVRSDSNTYIDCEFGFDTLVQSAARPTLWFQADGATRAKGNKFVNCSFTCLSSEATKVFILVANTSSLAFRNSFIDCTFEAGLVDSLSAAALTNAVASVSGLVEGTLNFVNPKPFGVTNFCAGVTDRVQVAGPAVSNNALAAVTPA